MKLTSNPTAELSLTIKAVYYCRKSLERTTIVFQFILFSRHSPGESIMWRCLYCVFT